MIVLSAVVGIRIELMESLWSASVEFSISAALVLIAILVDRDSGSRGSSKNVEKEGKNQ